MPATFKTVADIIRLFSSLYNGKFNGLHHFYGVAILERMKKK